MSIHVLTVLGARPQFVKAAVVSKAIQARDDVVEKARGLLTRTFSTSHADHVIDLTLGIADLDSVDPIIDAIAHP